MRTDKYKMYWSAITEDGNIHVMNYHGLPDRPIIELSYKTKEVIDILPPFEADSRASAEAYAKKNFILRGKKVKG